MTIEQARQQIKAHRIPMEDLLDELEWYRKQDLIRRGETLHVFRDTGFAIARIREIPKAEYRGGVDDCI